MRHWDIDKGCEARGAGQRERRLDNKRDVAQDRERYQEGDGARQRENKRQSGRSHEDRKMVRHAETEADNEVKWTRRQTGRQSGGKAQKELEQ